jgi:hypothetical protein
MTIGELRHELEQFDNNLMVVVSGYESGYDGVSVIQKVGLVKKDTPSWWEGEYDNGESESQMDAVYIGGKSREE